MKSPQIDRSATLRGRRVVVFVAGALAFGMGVIGVHAALASGSSSLRARQDHTVTSTPARPVAPAAVTDPVGPVTPAHPSPTAEPTSDPTALADGVYPTFVRAVDVRGATITFDVLQVFVGAAAHEAAIEDGVRWMDVRYNPVYIRNENPLLRTLPVARDVRIKLIAICMAPNRWVGLRELREATTPFTDSFYYEVTVAGGSVERIRQLVTVAGC
jgi:hypothetical protein